MAPLKQRESCRRSAPAPAFPRSAERGSIEAVIRPLASSITRAGFHAQLSVAPLKLKVTKDNGATVCSFHAQLSVAPLKRIGPLSVERNASAGFHAQLSVAPLKLASGSLNDGLLITFPRSAERGSIEALIKVS